MKGEYELAQVREGVSFGENIMHIQRHNERGKYSLMFKCQKFARNRMCGREVDRR